MPYYNDTPPIEVIQQIMVYTMEEQPNEWLMFMSCSDIMHRDLPAELQRAIRQDGDGYNHIEVPFYCYSMGVVGRNTFYGGLIYKNHLNKRSALPNEPVMIHENALANKEAYRLTPSDPRVAIYHLTHPNLEMVMDRHTRYAAQYVVDAAKRGRGRERVMRYAVNECIRTVWRYFRRGIFKAGETGKAQLMMLLMYNSMIFLNAFFSKEKEEEISETYRRLTDEAVGTGAAFVSGEESHNQADEKPTI